VNKPDLVKLSLESNGIESRGLLAISTALKDNTELKELYLYNNRIDDSYMEEFS
jgi:Leucine-rich repeat (LRR) protein